MYFANMYCYGFHNDCVGITGIITCMGVVYTCDRTLYAIHIPDHGKAEDFRASQVFWEFVNKTEDTRRRKGKLFLFVNGTNRNSSEGHDNCTAEQVGAELKRLFGGPTTTLCRLMTNLGPNSGGQQALAATIIVKHHITGLVMKFKHVPSLNMVKGGKAEIGQYKARRDYCGGTVPSAAELSHGWVDITKETCKIIKI